LIRNGLLAARPQTHGGGPGKRRTQVHHEQRSQQLIIFFDIPPIKETVPRQDFTTTKGMETRRCTLAREQQTGNQ
jgi:hypothetical protein